MNNLEPKEKVSLKRTGDSNQRGSAIVIAVFVLVLVSVFVALALTRTASEAAAVGNETAEARTFYAAQGSLEVMTRNFNKVFETKLNPSDADFTSVRNPTQKEPNLTPQYTFEREVLQVDTSKYDVINEGSYAGLYANRDKWRLRTTATDTNSGVQIQLTRNILNNRIPIFQFGIFYNDNLEVHPGPNFAFGGRVHSNGSIFLSSGSGSRLYFDSRVSTVGELITDLRRNTTAPGGGEIVIKNGSSDVSLTTTMGSVLKSPANGTPVFQDLANKPKLYDTDMPVEYTNTNWDTNEALFGGNLKAHQKSLDLPLKIASTSNSVTAPLDYIELIKRGKNYSSDGTDLYNDRGTLTAVTEATKDSDVTVSEKYYNKTGIRISFADRKSKLPGCASAGSTSAIGGVCGKRLDGDATGDSEGDFSTAGTTRGYQPLAMRAGTGTAYQATRLNGNRFNTTGTAAGRQMWIKIELVSKDATTNAVITNDVTADVLSLGVTEPAPCLPGKFWLQTTPNYYSGNCNATSSSDPFIDSRSIIKLQRFTIPGVDMVSSTGSAGYMKFFSGWDSTYTGYNLVQTDDCTTVLLITTCNNINMNATANGEDEHKKTVGTDTIVKTRRIVPFPIEVFDSREGVYNFNINTSTIYGTKIPLAGVMSMVDIDVKNFRRFLKGEFDNNMPTTTQYFADKGHVLRNDENDPTKNDVPQNSGWVVYISDRRGDADFDGEYDMEDIYGNNDSILQKGEDVNANGILDIGGLASGEAISYTGTTPASSVVAGLAASFDHPYYRRGVRLINGEKLPGKYSSTNSADTRGFTVASENGIYIQGNYNVTSMKSPSTGSPAPPQDYLPYNSEFHIPASIVGDAVTILSNYDPTSTNKDGWLDSRSFRFPYAGGSRIATPTFTRFAMLAGDAQSSNFASPNQGNADERLGGGVHNFKRFLEKWGSGTSLFYCGSLINLFNARNNNGSYKSNGIVYDAPNRNWVFDTSFLDPKRLPPGTPYFQYVQTTGFQRTND